MKRLFQYLAVLLPGLCVIVLAIVYLFEFGVVALLIVPFTAGVLGLFQRYVSPGSHWETFVKNSEEPISIALCAPMVLSVFCGLVGLLFLRPLHWLAKATWPEGTFQSVRNWPARQSDVETGFLGLNKIVWWLFADAPFELWLMVVIPTLWIAAYLLPFAIAKSLGVTIPPSK